MRAGPLSHPKVISLLNHYFVPVYAVNEDYRDGGAKPSEEKAELQRIFKQGYQGKFSVGTVHVYLLTPAGKLFDTLHVAEAAKTERLTSLLERAVETLGPAAGEPAVKPAAQSAPPKCAPNSLVLHLVSRGHHQGSWREFPAENWIELRADEWKKLLPPGEAVVGGSWSIEPALATRLWTRFYPQTENNDVA